MKKRIIAITAALAIALALPAYAAEWKQQGSTWQYQNDDGSMATGWQWINGKSYYFDAAGNMLASTTTPDGYQVNENGEWVVNGVVQTQQGGTAAQGGGTSSRKFTSLPEMSAEGYWKDKNNLTWTWWGESDGYSSSDGESVVIGNGPKYSDLHPGITDREHLLKEYVNYPGEGLTNLNSWGEPKANFDEDDLQLLREFVNSFDWINSDELTRAQAVYERIALGRHGNKYGSSYASTGAWRVLMHKEGVCADYAGEFKRLAEYIGLECVYYSPSVMHAANLVKINGQWISIDPQLGSPFFDNTSTVPVDFDIEYNRSEKEYNESESGQRMDKWTMLNEQYERGEITYEELEQKIIDLYK